MLSERSIFLESESSLVFLFLAFNNGNTFSVGVLKQKHRGSGWVNLEEVIPVKIALDIVNFVPQVIAASRVYRWL